MAGSPAAATSCGWYDQHHDVLVRQEVSAYEQSISCGGSVRFRRGPHGRRSAALPVRQQVRRYDGNGGGRAAAGGAVRPEDPACGQHGPDARGTGHVAGRRSGSFLLRYGRKEPPRARLVRTGRKRATVRGAERHSAARGRHFPSVRGSRDASGRTEEQGPGPIGVRPESELVGAVPRQLLERRTQDKRLRRVLSCADSVGLEPRRRKISWMWSSRLTYRFAIALTLAAAVAGAAYLRWQPREAPRPRYVLVNETGRHDFDLAFRMSLKL